MKDIGARLRLGLTPKPRLAKRSPQPDENHAKPRPSQLPNRKRPQQPWPQPPLSNRQSRRESKPHPLANKQPHHENKPSQPRTKPNRLRRRPIPRASRL